MSEQNLQKVKKVIVPLLPLRDIILFPHMVTPLLVGRDRSIRAIESSMEKDQRLFFVLQRVTKANDPHEADLYPVGTLGTAIQFVKLQGRRDIANIRFGHRDLCLFGVGHVHNDPALKHFCQPDLGPPSRLLLFSHSRITFLGQIESAAGVAAVCDAH